MIGFGHWVRYKKKIGSVELILLFFGSVGCLDKSSDLLPVGFFLASFLSVLRSLLVGRLFQLLVVAASLAIAGLFLLELWVKL